MKQINAFSLFEILIALTIIGVVLSFTDWTQLNYKAENKEENLEKLIRTNILANLAIASGTPKSPTLNISMPEFCEKAKLKVAAGGILDDVEINCGKFNVFVSSTGALRIRR